ncbi:uncharacterized protein BO80DRAFT_464241 [Aspergillus ibericus CBS 121593]|uniref:Protein kinase domain-containing protein n=1 Tax=Aspergillus ibericus CBS 121593 TaxID=1448316 RepID=A0A395H3C1_9EURO|nr:hypothetical protein BO80DRAFT_464241 [Aspergillus ibericus CBS 121593]RAL01695.1 hypothetical protein BO80DRAFT_464241 [Aspergillus ibericus CBS 121593]
MASALQNAQPSHDQILYLGDQPIPVTEVIRLDPNRTVYRVGIEPVGDLPQTVIVKQQKEGWEKEFRQEAEAYEKLNPLQGTVIPRLFGQGSFDGVPALVLSEVIGTTLYDLAHCRESPIHEKTLRTQLETVFTLLSEYGAVYWDQKVDNFLLCSEEDSGSSKVMVVDLEQVRFPGTFRSWEGKVNRNGARSLMRDFRDIRYPDREASPVRSWMAGSVRQDESVSRTTESSSLGVLCAR